MHELYSAPEIYDVAFSWDATTEGKFYAQILKRRSDASNSSNRRIVEFASGSGRMLRILRQLGFLGTGLDASPSMSRYALHNSEAEHLITADMMRTPFKNASYPAAISVLSSISALSSMTDIAAHLKEASRILTSDGLYLIDFLLGLPRRKREEWQLQKGRATYQVRWEIRRSNQNPNIFEEEIEVRRGKRRILRSTSLTTVIRREAFETAAFEAGLRIDRWLRPFKHTPLKSPPTRGRVIAALLKIP